MSTKRRADQDQSRDQRTEKQQNIIIKTRNIREGNTDLEVIVEKGLIDKNCIKSIIERKNMKENIINTEKVTLKTKMILLPKWQDKHLKKEEL